MDERWELMQDLKQSMKKPSLWERFKLWCALKFMPSEEVTRMREVLIKEAKPIFVAYWPKHKGGTVDARMDRFTIAVFDERINTLPKSIIYELYKDLQQLKATKTKAALEQRAYVFAVTLTLNYGHNGWFLKRLFHAAQTRERMP